MEPRMKHPAFVVPDVLPTLQALGAQIARAGVPRRTLELLHLRASQINGCSVCVDMHAKALRQGEETDERLFAVAAWRDSPHFTDAERTALALTDALTRMADVPDPVPDELWKEARRHFDETALSAILLSIASINLWNRLNVATKQVAGAWR